MVRAHKAHETPVDPLDAMLARLQLTGIRDQLDSLLDEAARAAASTVSSRARPSAIKVSAVARRPVAAPRSRRLSNICSRDFGVSHRIFGLEGSTFNSCETSFPEGAQT